MSLKEDDISEKELIEAILGWEIIENYADDKPFPSCLVFGITDEDRPIHVVCAYSKEGCGNNYNLNSEWVGDSPL